MTKYSYHDVEAQRAFIEEQLRSNEAEHQSCTISKKMARTNPTMSMKDKKANIRAWNEQLKILNNAHKVLEAELKALPEPEPVEDE
jgi:hypothetical protein